MWHCNCLFFFWQHVFVFLYILYIMTILSRSFGLIISPLQFFNPFASCSLFVPEPALPSAAAWFELHVIQDEWTSQSFLGRVLHSSHPRKYEAKVVYIHQIRHTLGFFPFSFSCKGIILVCFYFPLSTCRTLDLYDWITLLSTSPGCLNIHTPEII